MKRKKELYEAALHYLSLRHTDRATILSLEAMEDAGDAIFIAMRETLLRDENVPLPYIGHLTSRRKNKTVRKVSLNSKQKVQLIQSKIFRRELNNGYT